MTSMRRPRCLQCGAWNARKDYNPANNHTDIYCPICGNRYPGGAGFEMAVYRSRIPRREEVKPMKADKTSKKGAPCANCARPLGLVGGLCYACRKAAGKCQGQARETALAAIKRRIDAGQIHRGARSGCRIATPQPPSMGQKAEPLGACVEPPLSTGTAQDLAVQEVVHALARSLADLFKAVAILAGRQAAR